MYPASDTNQYGLRLARAPLRWAESIDHGTVSAERGMYPYRLVIPTRNSARWVAEFLKSYRALGIEPLYIVDSRSVDATLDILRRMDADLLTFLPSGDYVEAGMIEFASRQAGAKWILRLDDDEFPSKALLRWVDTAASTSLNQVFNISRRELYFEGGKVVFSRACTRYHRAATPHYLNPQPRLHHVDRVRYKRVLHTAGFEDPQYFSFAPEHAFFGHFSCLLRTCGERLEKIRFYETMLPGSTWRSADEWIPEIFSSIHNNPGSEGLEEFNDLMSNLPIIKNFEPPALSPQESLSAESEVRRLAHEIIASAKRGALPYRNADDFKWLSRIPKRLWRPFSEALCTSGARRFQEIGNSIYDYVSFIEGLD
jgi:hypothetical protein